MKIFQRTIIYFLLITALTTLTGCFYQRPIRHLTSEVSLIIPNQTTQKEIISYMGLPNQKKSVSDNEEEWLYFQKNKSLLRRIPLVGRKIGQIDYEVVIVRLNDFVVTSSQYRSLREEEFKQLGISVSDNK